MLPENQATASDAVSSDLKVGVTENEHVVGSPTAAVTLVEYGDFGCRFCDEAYAVVKSLQARFGENLRFVFRHNPRGELHPHARLAA